jgi:hypothetical protein
MRFAADNHIRRTVGDTLPSLKQKLNELDNSFNLPEGPYTFEDEFRARDILEAEYARTLSPVAHVADGAEAGPVIVGDAVIDVAPPSAVIGGEGVTL